MPDSRRRLHEALLALKDHEALRLAASIPPIHDSEDRPTGYALLLASPEDHLTLEADHRRDLTLLELRRQIQPAWQAVVDAAELVQQDCIELRIARRLKSARSWQEVADWLVPLPAEFVVDGRPEETIRERLDRLLPANDGFTRKEIHAHVGGYMSTSNIDDRLSQSLPPDFENPSRRNRKFPRDIVVRFLAQIREKTPIEILDGPKGTSGSQDP